MHKNEIKILVSVSLIYLAGVLGVWIHRLLIDVRPIHEIIPLLLVIGTILTVRLTLLRGISLVNIIRDFFKEKAHPMNLAIFRIIFFTYLLVFMPVDHILFFNQLPRELLMPPIGTGWALNFLPINESSINYANMAYRIFCFAGIMGLCTRFSSLMVALLGCYLLGIPQLFGKVNHYNHLIWFSLLLSTSRAGDFLSLDAIIRAIRKPGHSPQPSSSYCLPLRFIWILIAIIYFFPGIWKFYDSGFEWFFGDNLKLKLLTLPFTQPDFAPIFSLIDYPLLCKLLGIATVFFELSFMVFIIFPTLRLYAALGGLLFHNMTNIFMAIPFFYLQICYVAFFDWHKIFLRLGKLLFKEEAIILHDGNCGICKKTISVFKVIDIFGRMKYLNVLDTEGKAVLDKNNISLTEALTTMYVICGNKKTDGFYAYRKLSFRYPLLWPILPFLFIWPVPTIGTKIYQKIAGSRHCSIKPAPNQPAPAKPPVPSIVHVIAMGTFLILINSSFGFIKHGRAWPFACYPTFSHASSDKFSTLWIDVKMNDGSIIELRIEEMRQGFPIERYLSLVGNVLKISDIEDRNKRLEKLWVFFSRNMNEAKNVASVRFYKATFSILPENKANSLLEKKFIYEAFSW